MFSTHVSMQQQLKRGHEFEIEKVCARKEKKGVGDLISKNNKPLKGRSADLQIICDTV